MMSARFIASVQRRKVVAMKADRLFLRRLWVAGLLLPALAACSSNGGARGASSTSDGASAPVSSATPTSTTPPQTIAPIPDGVYRQSLTQDDVLAAGSSDLSNVGVWTFTVKSGKFELKCRPISESPDDCGGSAPGAATHPHPYLVEIGTLRGDDTTMWVVEDNALRHQLTGCVRHSTADTGCGPEDSYRLTWKATDNGLEFSDYFGLGDQATTPGNGWNWPLKPWTKIA
jgi:hypothetical protein